VFQIKRLYFLSFVFFLVLTGLLPSSSFGTTKRALLIGINNYKNLPYYSKEKNRLFTHLKGPLNDVRIMREALISRYGFREEEIKVLIEQEATRDNIIKTFEEWLVNGTREGDLVFFYFSGHGTQVDDQNGDEDDGKDEALCAYDLVPEGAKNVVDAKLIIDDELGEMLRKFSKRDVVVVVDACHSGTMTRSIRGIPVSELEETPAIQARFVPVKLDESSVRTRSFSIDIPKQSDVPEGQIFISSSRADQESVEIALPEGFHGALTSGLVEGMKEKKDRTYLDLFEYAKKIVKDRHGLEQDPQVEPMEGKIIGNVAFSLTYTIVPQAKPEDQSSSLIEPITPTTPPVLKPPQPPSLPYKPPVKPQLPQDIIKPQESVPATTVPSPTPPAPSQIEKPPSILKPPPEIKGEKILVRVDFLNGASISIMEELKRRLRAIPYVEVIKTDFFDRLIRGEIRDGKYHVRLLNRIGDVIKFPPTKNIDELIKIMSPYLEYAYIVKQLAHIRHPNPPFKVNISVTDDRRDFRIGEKIVFNISCEEDCYLLMLNLDSKGNFHIIFPNKYHADNFVKAGEKIQIPDQEMMKEKFEFQFFPPAGEETVKVIATNTKLNLEGLNLLEFREIFKSISGSAMGESSPSRSLAKEILTVLKEKSKSKEFRWGEDTVVVRSH
jgi:hypothetical protein